MDNQLPRLLALTIDKYRLTHPQLTAMEVLTALELIRFKLTEDLIREKHRWG